MHKNTHIYTHIVCKHARTHAQASQISRIRRFSDTRKLREVVFHGCFCDFVIVFIYVSGNIVYTTSMSKVQTTREPGQRTVNSLQRASSFHENKAWTLCSFVCLALGWPPFLMFTVTSSLKSILTSWKLFCYSSNNNNSKRSSTKKAQKTQWRIHQQGWKAGQNKVECSETDRTQTCLLHQCFSTL